MEIRSVLPEDRDEWLRMRSALWPDADPSDLLAEVSAYGANGAIRRVEGAHRPADCVEVFVCARGNGSLGGFVEVGLRNVVESAATSPVGFVEAWYVDPDLRRSGVGRALIARAEDWARQQGCAEMGSDTDLANKTSQQAHRAAGYRETARLVTFLKKLGQTTD